MEEENVKIKDVVFIDDDEINNFILKEIFENQYNLRVTFFTEAVKALEYLRDVVGKEEGNLPDIIFLDIKMPEMDGFDFLDHLQKESFIEEFNVPIFLLTSSVNHKDKEKALQYNLVKDLITKPLTFDKLNLITEKFY